MTTEPQAAITAKHFDPAWGASLDALMQASCQIIIGKEKTVKLAIACMLARGHLLIEDLPGVGKTTLAVCLARLSGLGFNRVQFTNDLLPVDLLGYNMPDRITLKSHIRFGPVFTNILLADEINRATPKTQSALLEAMEERQISLEGQTHTLPHPFFVMATQNPLEQHGTFPLPESQLDRFLFCISMGYPDTPSEIALLKGHSRRSEIEKLNPIFNADSLVALQNQVTAVHASDDLVEYLQRLGSATRGVGRFVTGLSPRALIQMLQAAKAWAFLHHRIFVLPEDVREIFIPLARHRLRRSGVSGAHRTELVEEELIELIKTVRV